MLLAGDEFGRTQRGNDNAWCQDNETSWVDWGLAESNAGLLRFTRGLIAFRRAHPVLRRTRFLTGRAGAGSVRPDVAWHGARLGAPDFGPTSHSLAMHLAGEHADRPDCDVYLAANASARELVFALPAPPVGERWLRVVATWEGPPADYLAPGEELPVEAGSLTVPSHSCALLRSG
jgi:isoamylase